MRVSVALGTYNGARFIREQVESILAQTRPVDEIVLGDDGSSDDTVDLVRELVSERVELVVLPPGGRLGVTGNFERIAAAATGDLVFFSDQDDRWAPEKVSTMLERFADGVDLVFSDAELVGVDGREIGTRLFEATEITERHITGIRRGRAFELLLRRNLITGATMAVRREAIERALPFPDVWVHDEWLAIVTAAFARIEVVETPLIDYRQHDANQIGARKPTLRYKIGRVFAPQQERLISIAERFDVLTARLEEMDAPRVLIERARGKRDHQHARLGLPRSRWARLPRVLRETVTGRYRRYSSRAELDILRDLLAAS